MNKSELIQTVAQRVGVANAAAGLVLVATLDVIQEAMARGEAVMLPGFGTFKPVSRAARVGRNPRTGEALAVAATVFPKFTAGAGFKAAVAAKPNNK
jgi:DNA-binding protein HU-beta